MRTLRPILLADDSDRDVELVLAALKRNHFVNAFVVKPVGFPQFVKAIRQTGAFWAAINEAPPQAHPLQIARVCKRA